VVGSNLCRSACDHPAAACAVENQMPHIVSGTVGYAALTHRLRYRASDRGLFAIVLADCQCFAPRPPRLFDRHNDPMPLQDIPPGSSVNIAITDDGWMEAVQVIALAETSPFAAVG
jgi:hypothetical protein